MELNWCSLRYQRLKKGYAGWLLYLPIYNVREEFSIGMDNYFQEGGGGQSKIKLEIENQKETISRNDILLHDASQSIEVLYVKIPKFQERKCNFDKSLCKSRKNNFLHV